MAEGEYMRAKATRYYGVVAFFLALLGVGMLLCAVIATISVEEYDPPYFIAGYIVGVVAFSALICISVIVKRGDTSGDVEKDVKPGCEAIGHNLTSVCMFMGCLGGLTIAGIAGIDGLDQMSSLNKNSSILMLVGYIIGLIVTMVSIYLRCAYDKYFYVSIEQRRRRQMLDITNSAPAPVSATHTHTTVFHTQQANAKQVNQLQAQNQLLQQQLELQRQLHQQQQLNQKQQQQYGGGFSNDLAYPPPPMYPPPPPYQDEK